MMLIERVTTDIGRAMQAQDMPRGAALRLLKTALMNREVERGRSLDATEDTDAYQRNRRAEFRLGIQDQRVNGTVAEIDTKDLTLAGNK